MDARHLTLIITGSIASVKSFDLARALKAQGSRLSVIITDAAQHWVTHEAMAPFADEVATVRDALLTASDAILIAPASADFISQLAHNNSPLARAINASDVPVFIAPAMNVMMWQHPATQRNVRMLLARGMIFLGPVQGSMACGDTGFGRFMEPGPIGDAVSAMVAGDGLHAAFSEAQQAIIDSPLLPQIDLAAAQKKHKHLLLLIQDGADVAATIAQLRAQGHDVTCAASEDVLSLPGERVYTHHFQDDPQGMEHIRLPERADMVLVVGATKNSVRTMVEGGAADLPGCIYLATKKPVLLIAADADDSDLTQLQRDGVYVLGSAPEAFENLMRDTDLSGKKILVTGGRPHEVIDGVRHFANHSRPQHHAAHAAQELTRRGAEVTLVAGNTSTAELLAACERLGTAFDSVLQLACIPAVRAADPSAHKLKLKTEAGAQVALDVVGNADIKTWLQNSFPRSALAGYDNQQRWFGDGRPLPAAHEPMPPITVTRNAPVSGILSGRHAIVTSGPTVEKISATGDVISNFSTGAQGHAIAIALANLGARVTLISGPASAPVPWHPGIRTVSVTSAKEMYDASLYALPADIFIGVAAVADFSMEDAPSLALKENEPYTLRLTQNPDILHAMGTHTTQRPTLVVGFAAETDNVLGYARGKLEKKNADIICANNVGNVSANSNQITYVTRDGNEALPPMSKTQIGEQLARKIAALLS